MWFPKNLFEFLWYLLCLLPGKPIDGSMMTILALTTPNQKACGSVLSFFSPLRHAPRSCRFLVKPCPLVDEQSSCSSLRRRCRRIRQDRGATRRGKYEGHLQWFLACGKTLAFL
ncbi:hypothetical protein BS78_01G434700 [Paspalum vaginatum]|nr:hypothetical protein BS78_01G434700 [Paspalum vaginatum]